MHGVTEYMKNSEIFNHICKSWAIILNDEVVGQDDLWLFADTLVRPMINSVQTVAMYFISFIMKAQI